MPLMRDRRKRAMFLAGRGAASAAGCARCPAEAGAREDAALRQQERVPGDHRHAGRHDAGADHARAAQALARAIVRGAGGRRITRSTPARRARTTSTAWCATTSCAAGPNQADIQVNLLPQDERNAQSHDIAKRVRGAIVAHRAAVRRAHESGRSAARPAGAADAGGRSLRPRLPAADRTRAPDSRRYSSRRAGRGGRGLVRRGPADAIRASWWIRRRRR